LCKTSIATAFVIIFFPSVLKICPIHNNCIQENYGCSASNDLEDDDEDSEDGYDKEEIKESTEGFVPTGEEVSEERKP
jgi:hypothetical protein